MPRTSKISYQVVTKVTKVTKVVTKKRKLNKNQIQKEKEILPTIKKTKKNKSDNNVNITVPALKSGTPCENSSLTNKKILSSKNNSLKPKTSAKPFSIAGITQWLWS